MTFNSLTFVLFFAVVVSAYWAIRSWNLRKWLLLAASYVFYGSFNPPFAVLLLATSALDFYLGARIARAIGPRARRGWLALSVTVNLSMLGFFKYGPFLLDSLSRALGLLGIVYRPPHLDILLPMGISFYTFHSLSYTLDIHRGTITPTRSWRDFLLAVSFFPQLVAGPIVRAGDFLPQCANPPRPDRSRFIFGLCLLTFGLFEKVVVADGLLAGPADAVYGAGHPLLSLDAWCGAIAFMSQIFFDFSGYSNCAIGAALCLGFHLKDNFRFPFAAVGFGEFWRRWHISLSTFMRDYLYLPLAGGSRRGVFRAVAAPLTVMLLVGLWHGAAWTFVAWGGLNGLLMIGDNLVWQNWLDRASWTRWPAMRQLRRLGTQAGVVMAAVFFRAPSFAAAGSVMAGMFGIGVRGAPVLHSLQIAEVGATYGCTYLAHYRLRDLTIEAIVGGTPAWLLSALWAAMAAAVALAHQTSHAFIYFQF